MFKPAVNALKLLAACVCALIAPDEPGAEDCAVTSVARNELDELDRLVKASAAVDNCVVTMAFVP